MQGNEPVTVTGYNFGPVIGDVTVQYGSNGRVFTTTGCSFGPATTGAGGLVQSLNCLTAVGVGFNLTWTVIVNGQTSVAYPPSGLSSSQYIAPSITSLTGVSLNALTTSGKQQVVLTGANFGAAGMELGNNLRVTYGPVSELGRRYTAQICAINASLPHVQIVCNTSSGVGSGHVWRVSVGEQESAMSTSTTSLTLGLTKLRRRVASW